MVNRNYFLSVTIKEKATLTVDRKLTRHPSTQPTSSLSGLWALHINHILKTTTKYDQRHEKTTANKTVTYKISHEVKTIKTIKNKHQMVTQQSCFIQTYYPSDN